MHLDPRDLAVETCQDAQGVLASVARGLEAMSKHHCLQSCQCGPCRAARLARQAADALQQEVHTELRQKGPSRAERSES